MTHVLPFHDPGKRKPFRIGTGQVYYGHRLRLHLIEPPVSRVERIAEWGRRNSRFLMALWWIVCAALGIAWGLSR